VIMSFHRTARQVPDLSQNRTIAVLEFHISGNRVIRRCTIHTADMHGITEQSDVESGPKPPFKCK
jgi:hypothetical protein